MLPFEPLLPVPPCEPDRGGVEPLPWEEPLSCDERYRERALGGDAAPDWIGVSSAHAC